MKKVLLQDEPNLTQEIIANLSPEQLQEIEGGAAQVADQKYSCFNASCNTATREEAFAE